MKIGCDIVENKRLVDKSDKFIDLILTDKEKELYKQRNKVEFLSGRFAAKEAVMKCLPNTKEIKFTDIEVLNDETGKPYCNIKGIEDISISHEKEYTIAVALYNEQKA